MCVCVRERGMHCYHRHICMYIYSLGKRMLGCTSHTCLCLAICVCVCVRFFFGFFEGGWVREGGGEKECIMCT